MNRLQLVHGVSAALKSISLLTGILSSPLIHFLPAELSVPALVAYGVVSIIKDVLSAALPRLESNEPLSQVALDTATDALKAVEVKIPVKK